MNEKTQAAMEQLEQGIEFLLANGQWADYLRIQSKFRSYSFLNTIMILIQFPNATRVAGFHKWKELGRHVKKGEKGIQIFAPLIGKVKRDTELEPLEGDTDGLQDETTPKQRLYGYKMVYVFDISQTEGAEIPSSEGLGPKILDGETGWYEIIQNACPFPIYEVGDLGGANGSYQRGTNIINILESNPEAQRAKTLIHEWAHAQLHGDIHGALIETNIKELEAESTAFIVAHALGFDTADYSLAYITGWSGEDAVAKLKASGARIQRAANEILNAIESQMAQKKEVA